LNKASSILSVGKVVTFTDGSTKNEYAFSFKTEEDAKQAL